MRGIIIGCAVLVCGSVAPMGRVAPFLECVMSRPLEARIYVRTSQRFQAQLLTQVHSLVTTLYCGKQSRSARILLLTLIEQTKTLSAYADLYHRTGSNILYALEMASDDYGCYEHCQQIACALIESGKRHGCEEITPFARRALNIMNKRGLGLYQRCISDLLWPVPSGGAGLALKE